MDSLANHVCVELDAAVFLLLIHTLYCVMKPGKTVKLFLKRQKVSEHGVRFFGPTLAGNNDTEAGMPEVLCESSSAHMGVRKPALRTAGCAPVRAARR